MGLELETNGGIDLPESFSVWFFGGREILPANIGNVVGEGADIIEVSRIQEAIDRNPLFIQLVYTPEEAAYCDSAKGGLRFQRYAARFAAKEAVAKAIGGMPHKFQDICILKDEGGKPQVELRGKAKDQAGKIGVENIHLSLSHITDVAIAFCIATRNSS